MTNPRHSGYKWWPSDPAVRSTIISLSAVSLGVLLVRLVLPFEFPLPWSDEAAFVSQAYALAHTGSLRVFALNPDRVLMWMPPGYMVVLALIIKVFGYSFGLSRWVSAAFFLAAYATCLSVLRTVLDTRQYRLACVFSVLVFLSPYTLVDANLCRMESLYVLCFLASLRLSMAGLPIVGASLVAVTGVIHFNAVYFLPVYMAYFSFMAMCCSMDRPGRLDIGAVCVAGSALLTYAIFCLLNWKGFLHDMNWQFALKAARPFRGSIQVLLVFSVMTAVPLVQISYSRAFTPKVFMTSYGAAFFLMALYGQESWYRCGYAIGPLLTVGEIASEWPCLTSWRTKVVLWAVGAVLVAADLGYSYSVTPATAPLSTLAVKSVLSRKDVADVAAFIRKLPPGKTVSFAYGFNGIEPFFFQDLAFSGTEWTMHTHGATEADPRRSADFRIHCDSALYKPMMNPASDGDYPRFGEDTGCRIIPWKPGP